MTSDVTSPASMPSSFSGSRWNTCNVSAYLSTSAAAPVSDSAPTISGDFSFHGSGQGAFGGTVSATLGFFKADPIFSYEALIFDQNLRIQHTLGLPGPPSRTRVSADGRYAATTASVVGHN